MHQQILIAALLLLAGSAQAIELAPLWDFSQPARSEQRFRDALASASPDDALVLRTQIARTQGMRGDFAGARRTLAAIEPRIAAAGIEPRTYYQLELGRSYSSATHPSESQTDAVRQLARTAFMRAYELAREGRLDHLAVDALHMMAFVDTAPADQLAWGRKALALALASSQPKARQWAGSLHHNIGDALHELGRYDEALAELGLALAERERTGPPGGIRGAQWMIARTLRAQGRLDEALEIQLRLEQQWAAAGQPDADVFEELELIYRALGNIAKAEAYAQRLKAVN